MLLHGNLMCSRQFRELIPLLEKDCTVYARCKGCLLVRQQGGAYEKGSGKAENGIPQAYHILL